jgi:hypothetical protein
MSWLWPLITIDTSWYTRQNRPRLRKRLGHATQIRLPACVLPTSERGRNFSTLSTWRVHRTIVKFSLSTPYTSFRLGNFPGHRRLPDDHAHHIRRQLPSKIVVWFPITIRQTENPDESRKVAHSRRSCIGRLNSKIVTRVKHPSLKDRFHLKCRKRVTRWPRPVLSNTKGRLPFRQGCNKSVTEVNRVWNSNRTKL